MLRYITGRILFFIPALFIVTLLAFVINTLAPGDPADRLAAAERGLPGARGMTEQQKEWRKKLGLDLPVFYVSVSSLARPAGLHARYSGHELETIKRLIDESGDARLVARYVNTVSDAAAAIDRHTYRGSERLATLLALLRHTHNRQAIISRLDEIRHADPQGVVYPHLAHGWESLAASPARWKNFVPVLRFHPMNQYHRWLFGDGSHSRGIVRGDFGISFTTREPVSKVIGQRMFWSVVLALVSIVLAYLVSIPVGVRAAVNRRGVFDRGSSVLLFLLYSIPVFWMATLLLMTFANPDVLKIFPAAGVKPPQGYPEGASMAARIGTTLPYLVLPVICYTYGAVAFLSRTMRASMLEVLAKPFIRTAYAKGLSQNQVVYRHALPNALLPLITVFANVFPLAISGSVVIETVFSIPGMGLETYLAIHNLDFPMITAVFTITGALTLTGYLLSDLMYAAADPRISYSSVSAREK